MKMEQQNEKIVKAPMVQRMRIAWDTTKALTGFAVKHPVITSISVFAAFVVLAEGCKDSVTNNNNFYYANPAPVDTSAVDTTKYQLVKSGIISITQVLDAGMIKVRLNDLSLGTGPDNTHNAILQVLDANNATLVKILQVAPGTHKEFTAPDGKVWVIACVETFATRAMNQMAAELRVYVGK